MLPFLFLPVFGAFLESEEKFQADVLQGYETVVHYRSFLRFDGKWHYTTPLKNPTKDQICGGEYVTLSLSYVRIRFEVGEGIRKAVECSIFAVVGYDSSCHYFP